jgi:hypothetical protein
MQLSWESSKQEREGGEEKGVRRWWWVGVGSDAQSDISFEVCSRFELSLFKTDLVDLND